MKDLANYFANDGFLLYVALLGISAVLLLVLFFLRIGSRAWSGILGAVAVAYTVYLLYIGFIVGEGTVFVSIYAMILPILAVYELVKGVKARNAAAEAAAAPGQFPQAPPAA